MEEQMSIYKPKIFQGQFSRHLMFEAKTSHVNRNYRPRSQCYKLLSLLKLCKFIKPVRQIHAQMLIHCVLKPNFLLPKLVELKEFHHASLLFTSIPEPDEYAFNIMIRGLATTWGRFNLALEHYVKMKALGLKPDNFTYPFVFISCGNLLAKKMGGLAHCEVVKNGLGVDFHVVHSMITMYSRCGELRFARKLFDEMSVRHVVSWNSMISGYAQMGFAREAVELFEEMRNNGMVLGEMALVSVLGACGDLGDLGLGRSIEAYIMERRMEVNSYIGSALIDMYGNCGDLDSARAVFDTMEKKDLCIWNAMITKLAQNGSVNEAISLFNTMKEGGPNPNEITLSGVLSACASVGALDLGKSLEKYAQQRGFHRNIYVATALVDMYSKCGALDHAFRVFENLPQKNDVSWNSMISALASHGRAEQALSLFQRMLQDHGTARPNDITFVGLLSACVHAGLVDEGYHFFHLMASTFGLIPKIEHYSCMVDLLSRAGRLYEAWDFVQKMPDKPDEILLGALLGACHKMRNVDIAERVMQLLLEMEPTNSANYIISSQIYANMRRWDDSARMRVLMRHKGVAKTPGCSWIEMYGQLHEFHAGDFLFPGAQDTFGVLDVLYEDMEMEISTLDIDLV